MSKNNKVDEFGIRLAPAPMEKENNKTLETVVQPCELVATLSINDKVDKRADGGKKAKTTVNDFQPKESDLRRPYFRKRRLRNLGAGLLMLIISLITIAPFILGYFDVPLELPFNYSFKTFNVLQGLQNAIQTSIDNGWSGAVVNEAWVLAVPSLILTVGLLAIVFNVLKSIVDICGSKKGKKFGFNVIVFLISVLAIFIASLVGAEQVGINKIDIMVDFVQGWQSSELVTLLVLSGINLLGAIIAKYVSPNNSGY